MAQRSWVWCWLLSSIIVARLQPLSSNRSIQLLHCTSPQMATLSSEDRKAWSQLSDSRCVLGFTSLDLEACCNVCGRDVFGVTGSCNKGGEGYPVTLSCSAQTLDATKAEGLRESILGRVQKRLCLSQALCGCDRLAFWGIGLAALSRA